MTEPRDRVRNLKRVAEWVARAEGACAEASNNITRLTAGRMTLEPQEKVGYRLEFNGETGTEGNRARIGQPALRHRARCEL